LVERGKSGRGQVVDTDMVCLPLHLISNHSPLPRSRDRVISPHSRSWGSSRNQVVCLARVDHDFSTAGRRFIISTHAKMADGCRSDVSSPRSSKPSSKGL
jgi:hypothetical protein